MCSKKFKNQKKSKNLKKSEEGILLPALEKNQKSPWLHGDGTLRSDAEISLLGKTWPVEIWKAYLDSTVGDLKNEDIIFFPYIDTQTMSEGLKMLQFLQYREYYPELRSLLELAMEDLSRAERVALEGYFWEEKTYSEVAQSLGVSSVTVRVLKGRALKKLKEILKSKALTRKANEKKNRENNPLLNPVSLHG